MLELTMRTPRMEMPNKPGHDNGKKSSRRFVSHYKRHEWAGQAHYSPNKCKIHKYALKGPRLSYLSMYRRSDGVAILSPQNNDLKSTKTGTRRLSFQTRTTEEQKHLSEAKDILQSRVKPRVSMGLVKKSKEVPDRHSVEAECEETVPPFSLRNLTETNGRGRSGVRSGRLKGMSDFFTGGEER